MTVSIKILKSLVTTAIGMGAIVFWGCVALSAQAADKPTSAGSAAQAKAFVPAIVFDQQGPNDKSFGQAAYEGLERFKKETGVDYLSFEIANDAQRVQGLQKMAERGASLVIAVGYGFANPVQTVAPKYPETKFLLIDGLAEGANIKSVLFKEQEGAFLVGMMAALKSKTGKIGFVGGADVSVIQKFASGYKDGAKFANPSIEVFENMVGTGMQAWNDPARAGELAKSQIDRGADVIFAAAGGSGLGVYQAAADAKILAIGVDVNQNYLQPGTMLTSMVKRVDEAIFSSLKDSQNGQFKPGLYELGVVENGVGYAIDDFNKDLLSKEIIDQVEKAKSAITKGEIKVTDITKKTKEQK